MRKTKTEKENQSGYACQLTTTYDTKRYRDHTQKRNTSREKEGGIIWARRRPGRDSSNVAVKRLRLGNSTKKWSSLASRGGKRTDTNSQNTRLQQQVKQIHPNTSTVPSGTSAMRMR